MNTRKPHIIKQRKWHANALLGGCHILGGDYTCTDGRWMGWGWTPQQAYEHWAVRDAFHSCVHNRPTRLQQRNAA